MERDVHVRTKRALDAEQAAHAATRDRTVMRVVESKRALEAEQVAHAATRAELTATKGPRAHGGARRRVRDPGEVEDRTDGRAAYGRAYLGAGAHDGADLELTRCGTYFP